MAARWWRLRAARLRTLSAELESEEARIEQRRRTQAARLRRLQRLMEPAKAPERTLSRQAMEQMRSLRQDAPEEWPVARLARSFQVSPDVVGRVLRSRFSPSPERALEQNSRLPPLRSGCQGHRPPLGRAGPEALAPEAARRKGGGSGAPPPESGGHPQRRRLRVVQKGREFVDEDGNLLYRIPA